jgi:hypothetical protein
MSVLPDLERDLLDAADRWLAQREQPSVARPRRWGWLAAGCAAVGGVVAVVLVVTVGGQSQALALASRAYEQTSVAPGQILYTRVVGSTVVTDASGTHPRDTVTIEEWHRGRETHRLETYRSPEGKLTAALDHVIGADGVMRQIDEQGGYRIVRPSDNQDAASVIANQQAGVIEEFRRRYIQGRLDAAGDATFAGRPARRYVVVPQPAVIAPQGSPFRGAPAPVEPKQAFYVDQETGMPLGYTSSLPLALPADGGVPQTGTTTFEETVRAVKHLTPTSNNLAKLHHFLLPRRRDAQGCIRGPVQQAHPSDSAPKHDCGGTPGAVVRRPAP